MNEPIDELVREIAQVWPFDQQHYPNLQSLGSGAVRHITLHLMKDVGRLATSVERLDHGFQLDPLQDRALRNILVSALRLCGILGTSPAELIREYLREHAAR